MVGDDLRRRRAPLLRRLDRRSRTAGAAPRRPRRRRSTDRPRPLVRHRRPVPAAARRGHDGRDRRLRLGQPALGGEGLRARGARVRLTTSRSWSPTIPTRCARADRVVLPGVGAFADCRRGLDAVPGMVEALNETVRSKGRPFLGICVGMQLMAERGREYEVIDGPRLDPRRGRPHRRRPTRPEDPAHGLEHAQRAPPPPAARRHSDRADGLHGYFVHSYHLEPTRPGLTSSPTPTMAARSPRSWRATTWSARSSTRRRARQLGPGADRQFPESGRP